MKQKFLVLIILFSTITFAQETTLSSSKESTGTNGSVSYSVGLIFVEPLEGANGQVSQGVQVANEVSQLLGTNDAFNDITLQVYPNPSSDFVILKKGKHTAITYQLYDSNGRIIRNQKTNTLEDKIGLQQLQSGIYLLKIVKNNTEIKTFKIIKK